ncbi:GNAT family N-acetyltransferase [Mangrovimonas aestuarii]|uniref:GNAT family N-acetyltransferase n=1 Tax=Mangrovimonas aestuarii TaxID=3018443 RepID=UPI002379BD4C|nr:GNAT family N-acetyltransferase [Mangrovimonas aestuarii]
MEIKHKQYGKKGAVFIERNKELLAEMVYSISGPEKIIIEHTEVGDEIRGQGVGYQLLEFLVDYMRENNIKAIPLCPFTKAAFNKKPEYRDRLI